MSFMYGWMLRCQESVLCWRDVDEGRDAPGRRRLGRLPGFWWQGPLPPDGLKTNPVPDSREKKDGPDLTFIIYYYYYYCSLISFSSPIIIIIITPMAIISHQTHTHFLQPAVPQLLGVETMRESIKILSLSLSKWPTNHNINFIPFSFSPAVAAEAEED